MFSSVRTTSLVPLQVTIVCLAFVCLLVGICPAAGAGEWRIGVMVPGEYAWHSLLRTEFSHELELLVPDTVKIIYPPDGYATAEWDREESRQNARAFAENPPVDLLVTFGPWVVEDLLQAGYTGPIVAMHRFDPIAEGLVARGGRPTAENVTVTLQVDRYQKDLRAITQLMPVKRLGFLAFPSADEEATVLERLTAVTEPLGIEVVTASDTTPTGRYAYFKAYSQLEKPVDLLYVGPMWGVTPDMMREFFSQATRDKIPVFSWEGRFHVTRGALAADAGQTAAPEAIVAAWKVAQIIGGAVPADLPVVMPTVTGLSINERVADLFRLRLPEYTQALSELVDDPVCTNCDIYTLPQALGQALAANSDYLASLQSAEAARARAGAVSSEYLPQVSIMAGLDYVDENTVNNQLPEPSRLQSRAVLTVEQRVLSIATLRAIEAARLEADRVQQDTLAARLQLEKAVTLAFLQVLASDARLDIEISGRRAVERFMEIAQARESTGNSERDALLRWRSEWHRAVSRVADARVQRKNARTQLRRLLMLPEAGFVVDSQFFSAAALAGDYGRARADRLTDREIDFVAAHMAELGSQSAPEVEAVSLHLSAERARSRAIGATWIPSIGLQAQLGWQDELEDQSGVFEEKTPTWSVGARLHWSLFSGGKRSREQRGYDLSINALEHQQESARLAVASRIRTEVRQWLQELIRSRNLFESYRSADAYLRLRAESPSGSVVEHLDAFKLRREAALAALDNRISYFRLATELVTTLGWSMHERNGYASRALITELLGALSGDQ